jgi:glycerate kinase
MVSPYSMKVLIAPDSYKDCLSAGQVGRSIARGFGKAMPEAKIRIIPMADGGEGTVESVIEATGGKVVRVPVLDPLGREIDSFLGVSGDGRTAVIEMAAASGLELLAPDERNPWITSTFGTGQLIRHALDLDCRRILIGIGGSATNDCGLGMAMALGIRFLDVKGNPAGQGGGVLGEVSEISFDDLDPRIGQSDIQAACDVTNPLTGPEGASLVYGPQKGADPEMAGRLERNLLGFSGIISRCTGKEISHVPGAGAAGGLGAGLMAFLGARLVRGFDMVAECVKLEEEIRMADLVITGEGKMDRQTLFGKTPCGVAQLAVKYGKPVISVTGSLDDETGELGTSAFTAIIPILEKPSDLVYAMEHAPDLLERTGTRIARMISAFR